MTILEEAAVLASAKAKQAEEAAIAKRLADEERERAHREHLLTSRGKAFSLIKGVFKELEEDGFAIDVDEKRYEVGAHKNGQLILRGVTCIFGGPNYYAGVTLCAERRHVGTQGRIIIQTSHQDDDFPAYIRRKMIEYFADNPI